MTVRVPEPERAAGGAEGLSPDTLRVGEDEEGAAVARVPPDGEDLGAAETVPPPRDEVPDVAVDGRSAPDEDERGAATVVRPVVDVPCRAAAYDRWALDELLGALEYDRPPPEEPRGAAEEELGRDVPRGAEEYPPLPPPDEPLPPPETDELPPEPSRDGALPPPLDPPASTGKERTKRPAARAAACATKALRRLGRQVGRRESG